MDREEQERDARARPGPIACDHDYRFESTDADNVDLYVCIKCRDCKYNERGNFQ
jgi:hypothetical protein